MWCILDWDMHLRDSNHPYSFALIVCSHPNVVHTNCDADRLRDNRPGLGERKDPITIAIIAMVENDR